MRLLSSYPVLCSPLIEECHRFWTTHFGFETTFATEWYVSLCRPDGVELALLDPTHPTVPAGHRIPVQGVLINLEVEDVDAEWERLVVHGGLDPVSELRSENFGQRHFIVSDPAGVLVDIITEIPPAPEFLAAFGP